MHKLKQVLAQEDSVLFVGSGVSLWSGLPTWSQIIEELALFVESSGINADLVRSEAERGDLLQAASYGFDKLTKQQIGNFIRMTCRYGVAKPHDIHRKIVSLGTRCFITTNYDSLLEEALRLWQSDRFFRPPVTNRHLTETAEIVHARAIDFVFKPHGDAADSDSIILTREQYRQLLPQGERHYVLESLKMLLASRPVVYIGFGLRDPDFMYVRDLLANTYPQGGIRDHYAIMADVSDTERDYWRRNYGIHLVNYATTTSADGSKDHTALLALLDSLLEPTPVLPATDAPESYDEMCGPEVVLSLARHAARLLRTPKVTPEFPIRVHADLDNGRKNDFYSRQDRFDHCPVEKFLDDGPERVVLVGLPGAGKTYALSRAAARQAEKLHEACMSDPFDEKVIIVPVFVDLKLYHGDLAQLVSQTLPPCLPFHEVTRRFQTKIFLDSFNEMPRQYWESGSYEADFAEFTTSVGRSSVVIGSRTRDGLAKLGFPTYVLDQIDDSVVDAELQRLEIDSGGRFDRDIRSLLQKPFYFQLITTGTVNLPKEAHPRDFYESFFANLHESFAKRFGREYELEEALSLAAYDAINRGEEAYPLSDLLRALEIKIVALQLQDLNAHDIANWLVSSSVLIPHMGGRIAFVHQSITEFLAAKELARRYQAAPQILKEKLTLTRWDQSLFLALSLLPSPLAEVFFHDIVSTDLVLALTAAKFLEVGRDEVVSKLLAMIPGSLQAPRTLDRRLEWLVGNELPVSDLHEPQLRTIMELRDSIGGAAAMRLIAMKGTAVKNEMLRELVEAKSDYNYCCNGVARALSPLATLEDIHKIVELADSISGEVTPDSDEDIAQGFRSGAATFLQDLDLYSIKEGFLPASESGPVPEIRARILCDILRRHHSTMALDLAGELLLRGVKKAATAIYFIAHFAEPTVNLSWASFTIEHVNSLITASADLEEETWALKALKFLCSGRQDLAEVVKTEASRRAGIAKACLMYCATPTDRGAFFEALAEFVNKPPEERKDEATELLKELEIDWTGHEDLFVQMLRLRDSNLALAILENVFSYIDSAIGQLEIGPIEWWLDWIQSEDDPKTQYWLADRMSWVFSSHISDDTRQSFVAEFNKSGSKYRRILANFILARHHDLTTDDFSADAVSFLLADLTKARLLDWRRHLLGSAATEQFVEERLLPLLRDANGPLLNNLKVVLTEAGARHGRRYLVE